MLIVCQSQRTSVFWVFIERCGGHRIRLDWNPAEGKGLVLGIISFQVSVDL